MKKVVIYLSMITLLAACSFINEFWEPSDIVNALLYPGDAISPQVSILSPTNGQIVGADFVVTCEASDDDSGVKAVYVRVAGGSFSIADSANGRWEHAVQNLSLPNGSSFTVEAFSEDNAGNSSTTDSVALIRDAVPAIVITSPSDGQATNQSFIQISGTSGIESPFVISKVYLQVGGGAWQTATGTTNWNVAVGLTPGSNTVTARVLSDNGKTNTSLPLTLLYDNVRPTLAITYPTNDGQEIGSMNTFSGNSGDDFSGVLATYIRFDTSAFVPIPMANGSWSTNYAVTVLGAHTNYAYCVDRAGNVSITQSITFVRSSIPWIIIQHPVLDNFTNAQTVTFSGTAGIDTPYSITKVEVKTNSGPWMTAAGTTAWSANVSLSTLDAGTNRLSVRAIGNNNRTNTILDRVIYYYPTGLSISIVSPADGSTTNSSAVTVTGTVSVDPHYGLTVQTRLNGGSWQTAAGTTTWSNTLSLSLGANTVEARAIASCGETNWTTNTVTYSVEPLVWFDLPTSQYYYTYAYSNILISGTAFSPAGISAVYMSTNGSAYFQISGTTTWSNACVLAQGYPELNIIKVFSVDNDTYCSRTNVLSNVCWNKLEAVAGPFCKRFGASVACVSNGETVFAGADSSSNVYVSWWNGAGWSQTNLKSSDNAQNFGSSVACTPDGRVFVSGAINGFGVATSTGTAYIFTNNGVKWMEAKKLYASDGIAVDSFGSSTAISTNGQIVIVGAGYAKIGIIHPGAAYIYQWNGSSWDETKLIPPYGYPDGCYGSSVACSADGRTVVVGADNYTNASGIGTGVAYIYTNNNTTWLLAQRLTPSDGISTIKYGISVACSADGSRIFIGAKSATGIAATTGAVYAYQWNGSAWAGETKLYANDGAASDLFGSSVACSSDGLTLTAGASGVDIASLSDCGAVYVFKWDGSWTQFRKLIAADGTNGDNLGGNVACSADGREAVGGAYSDDILTTDEGSAWVYVIE